MQAFSGHERLRPGLGDLYRPAKLLQSGLILVQQHPSCRIHHNLYVDLCPVTPQVFDILHDIVIVLLQHEWAPAVLLGQDHHLIGLRFSLGIQVGFAHTPHCTLADGSTEDVLEVFHGLADALLHSILADPGTHLSCVVVVLATFLLLLLLLREASAHLLIDHADHVGLVGTDQGIW